MKNPPKTSDLFVRLTVSKEDLDRVATSQPPMAIDRLINLMKIRDRVIRSRQDLAATWIARGFGYQKAGYKNRAVKAFSMALVHLDRVIELDPSTDPEERENVTKLIETLDLKEST